MFFHSAHHWMGKEMLLFGYCIFTPAQQWNLFIHVHLVLYVSITTTLKYVYSNTPYNAAEKSTLQKLNRWNDYILGETLLKRGPLPIISLAATWTTHSSWHQHFAKTHRKGWHCKKYLNQKEKKTHRKPLGKYWNGSIEISILCNNQLNIARLCGGKRSSVDHPSVLSYES